MEGSPRCIHLSSSSCFSTSPIICPTLCSALMLSSVISNCFCRPLMSIRRALSFASQSLDSISLFLNASRACCLSGSPPPSMTTDAGDGTNVCWLFGREASVVLRSVRQLNSSAACMGRKTASRVGIVAQIYLFAIDLSDACLAELSAMFS